MNEQLWLTFKTVAEMGSLSKAARRLSLSPSAVSQQIQQIESYYGANLFLRSSQGMVLTEAGEVLYRYVYSLLITLNESRDALLRLKKTDPETLSIGASMTIAEHVLPSILPAFCQPTQNTRISVVMANSQTIFDQVRHGELDIGLVEATLSDPQLVIRPFYEDRPLIVTSSTHPWTGREVVTLEEFLKEAIILREPGSGTRMALESGLRQLGIGVFSLNVRLVLGTTQAIKSMVAAGVGISVLSPLAVDANESSQFHFLSVENLGLRRNFYLVYSADLVMRTAHQFIQSVMSWERR